MNEQQLAAAQPAQDNTYGYAKSLAESLFKKHYAHEEPYASGSVVWEVSDTTIGVLTQIDNMVCTLVHQPAPVQEPVAWMRTLFSPELGEFFDYKDGAFANETDSVGWTPLYTAPQPVPVKTYHDGKPWPVQPKPWVGLTDEDLEDIAVAASKGNLYDLRIVIEAKLKGKNHDQ
jgi:hypothetical protein